MWRHILLAMVGVVALVTLGWLLLATPRVVDQPTRTISLPKPSAMPDNAAPTAPPPHHATTQFNETPLSTSAAWLAQAHAAELQYPPYSQPLRGNLAQVLPPAFFAIAMPLQGGGQLSLQLNQYRVIAPEQLRFSIDHQGSAINSAQAEIIDPEQPQQPALWQTRLTAPANQAWQSTVAMDSNWPRQLQLRVKVNATSSDGERGEVLLVSDFEYLQPVARLNKVLEPSAKGADLLLPLLLAVDKAGTYRIRAVLYQQDNPEPLVLLTNEQPLNTGEQIFTLKAHQTALQQAGPWLLQHITIERRSDSPFDSNDYGIAPFSPYPVNALALSALTAEPYQPSREEQTQLDFLQQLAGQ